MKILVVDDNEAVRNAMKRLLNSMDHEVILADDGTTALEIFIKNYLTSDNIKIIITDYHMIKMNGDRLAKEIKLLNNFIPVILFSSDPDALVDHSNTDYVLHKNLDIGYLLKIIENIANENKT